MNDDEANAQVVEQSTTAVDDGNGRAVEHDPPPAEAVAPQPKAPISVGDSGLKLANFDDMWRFANAVDRAGWGPKNSNADSNLVAMQFGAELGVGPMQAIQNICVINGRPSAWGDLPLGICMRSPLFDHAEFKEWTTGKPFDDDFTAHCRARRQGGNVSETTFSVADAKKAKLWGGERTTGIWTSYAKRMLMYRARGYRLRDTFPDVLKGLYTGEELSTVDEIMAQFDHGKRSEAAADPPAAESRDTFRKQMTDQTRAPKKSKKGKETAKPEPPTAVEHHADDPALIRTAIMAKWKKIPKAEHRRVCKNLDIIGISIIDEMDDAEELREINEGLIGEVPADAQ